MGCEVVEQQDLSLKKRNNIISRNSSVGTYSSRMIEYYRSNASEGIPFQWEMQPGTPKDPRREDSPIIDLPLSPPPAMLSLGFPKPSLNKDPMARSYKPRSKFNLVMLWINKKSGFRAKGEGQTQHHHHENSGSFCNLGEECFSASPRCESSWSDSSSPSFSNGFSRPTMMRSCSSWKLSSILFRRKMEEK